VLDAIAVWTQTAQLANRGYSGYENYFDTFTGDLTRPPTTAETISQMQNNVFGAGNFGGGTGLDAGSDDQLGMYIDRVSPQDISGGAVGGGSVLRSSGYGVTDTAGALAPGTRGPSVRDVSGNGGIFGTIDATRLFGLPANQSLVLTGFFDYRHDNASLGAAPGAGALVIGNAGSLQSDTYTLGGTLFYGAGSAYLRGGAAYNFGHSNETNSLLSSAGGFNSNGYSVDANLGNVFTLLNTSGAHSPAALPTKAPPKLTGGYFVGLDLSGHIGSFDNWGDGFADSSGFIFGTNEVRSGDIGGRAELFALVPGHGLLWRPYVAGTVDQLFGFSSTLNIPSQAALPGGDLVSLQAAQTFGGAQLGLDVLGPRGLTVGVKGFYQASADTNITGGNIYLKIPFNYTPTVASRY
jgi:hypothetical protein